MISGEREYDKKSEAYRYRCICSCGAEVWVFRHTLVTGKTVSCGCARNEATQRRFALRRLAMTGSRFGRLVATDLSRTRIDKCGLKVGEILCRCDCGEELYVSAAKLNGGVQSSCGCLSKGVEIDGNNKWRSSECLACGAIGRWRKGLCKEHRTAVWEASTKGGRLQRVAGNWRVRGIKSMPDELVWLMETVSQHHKEHKNGRWNQKR